MSSENEMIDHPGDEKPEIESQAQQLDPSAETLPEPTSESDAPAEKFEDGWDAWMSTNPEEEDVSVSPPEPIAETDTEPSNEETTEDAAEQKVEQSQDETTETAAEQNAELIDGETTEAADEPETVSEADENLDKQESEDSPSLVEAEAAEAAEDKSDESDTDHPDPPPSKPSKPKKQRRDGLTTEHVITYFAPCGRCGFFLSGYRATYGLDNLETAVSEAKSGWLTLTWGQEMQELVLKSYGSRIEPNDLLFDGCCSECRRAFVYKSARSEKKPATFRIEIKPRKRQ